MMSHSRTQFYVDFSTHVESVQRKINGLSIEYLVWVLTFARAHRYANKAKFYGGKMGYH